MKVFILTLLVAFQVSAQQTSAYNDITHEAKDFKAVPELAAYQRVSDTSYAHGSSYDVYGVRHLRKGNKHMILLIDRLLDAHGNATGFEKIKQAFAITTQKNEGIVIGYCGLDTWDIDSIYVVAFDREKAKATTKFEKSINHIWKADTDWEITEVPIPKELECFSDATYLINLSLK